MRHTNRQFGTEVVDLDGSEFVDCAFVGTTLRYSGGEPPVIVGCSFQQARFVWDGPAARTVGFLQAMSKPESGLRSVVQETFGSLFAN